MTEGGPRPSHAPNNMEATDLQTMSPTSSSPLHHDTPTLPLLPTPPSGLTPAQGAAVGAGRRSVARYRPGGWGSLRGGVGVGCLTERGVAAEQQMDRALIWWDSWDLDTRCALLEAISGSSGRREWRFLLTVTQPWLHRDLMYWGHGLFPHLPFQPLSTHLSRKVKEREQRLQRPAFHRVDSCYPHADPPSLSLPSLPPLSPSPSPSTTASTTSRVTETLQMHVRRHIQNESSPRAQCNSFPGAGLEDSRSCKPRKAKTNYSRRKTERLPQEGHQLLTWYLHHWNEEERQTFLHHLLVSLDPREHYFLSACLLVRQHVDFLTQLPERLALHVLSYFSPRELGVVSRVSKAWRRLANHNSLWESKCREVKLEVPVCDNPVWKRVFRDNHLLRYNWSQGRCRVTDFQGHKLSVLTVCLDKWRVASGSADTTVRVWDIATGKKLHVLTGHSKGVWCLQFFTQHLLLSGSYDSTIRMWNLRNGSLCRTLLGHGGPVWCLARRGHCLVSGSNDKTVKIWDIGRCVLLNSLAGHKAAVFAVDINEDSTTVYSGSADRTVRLWERQTGACIRRIRVSGNAGIMSLSVSQGYFACCHGTSVCLYRGTTLIATFKEHEKRIETVKLRVDPETEEGLIVSGGHDGLCKYWDIHREDSIQTFRGHTDSVNCIYFDEVRIVSASHDLKIRLWDFVL